MKKNGHREPPAKGMQDLSVPEMAKLTLRGMQTGDPTELIRTLEASIPPEAPRQQPVRYSIHVPLLAVDGTAAIGKTLRIVYSGEGDACELELEGAAVTVRIAQLCGVLEALRGASYTLGPGYPR